MTLIQFSRFFAYLAVFCVTIVLSSTFFPFIGGKYYFFRFAVELSLLFLILAWALEDERGEIAGRLKRISREPLFLAVSFFALAFLLATAFAHDPAAAFWSNFERGDGGFQMIHYYLFFVLLLVLMRTKEEWFRLFKASMAAGLLMILYGVLAAARIDGFVGPYYETTEPTTLTRIFSPNRFQGSLGNPAYVAPYLMFVMFYSCWLWFSKKVTLQRSLVFGGLNLVYLTFFLLSGTRGAFLGLLAAGFVFLAYLILEKGGKTRKVALISLAVLLAAGALIYPHRKSPVVQNLPGGRLIDISLTDVTAQTRFWTWGSAWEGFKERPIFGWGPENFSTVFDRHFNPNHFVPGKNTETWFDRAHSVIFDYLAETGIVGLAAYLGMFGTFYWLFWKRLFGKEHDSVKRLEADSRRFGIHDSALLRALLVAMPVGYLVQALILFDVLPIFMNLIIFFAFATAVYHERHELQS